MRKLIVANIVTLDGYYTGPGGDVMVMPMDAAFDEYNAERLRAAHTLLLGRTTYEGLKSFWPGIADDPDETPVHREISRRNNEIDKVVVSDTLTEADTAPWHNTEIVRRAAAHERTAELKKGAGGDILMFGSRTLWNDLLAVELVDELHLMIGPVILGDGVRAFDGAKPASLRLAEPPRIWDGSQNVLMRLLLEPRRLSSEGAPAAT